MEGIEQYCVSVKKSNICFDCDRACGGCSWSRNFEPVPGWTATKTTLKIGCTGKEKPRWVDTYSITACPLFTPDPLGRTEEQDNTGKTYMTKFV
jgi:hypothetical protein